MTTLSSALRTLRWFAVLVIVACDSTPAEPVAELPLSRYELMRLEIAESRWRAHGPANYTYEAQRSSGASFPGWLRVEVRNGTTVRVTRIDTGEEMGERHARSYPPIEQFFEGIRGSNSVPYVGDLQVEFDEELGFPTLIAMEPRWELNYQDMTRSRADIRNFRPLVN